MRPDGTIGRQPRLTRESSTTESGSYYAPLQHMWRSGNISRYPMYDGIGTSRGLVNDSATITDTYQLDAWGHQIASSGSTQNPYKYGAAWGYITDPSGLLQLGHRFYWPELGRFVQRDPVGATEYIYAYGGNQPSLYIDPEGLRASASWVANLLHSETWSEGLCAGWQSGYYACYAKCVTIGESILKPTVTKHIVIHKAAHPWIKKAGTWYGRWAWTRRYPRWFRAGGKKSKVLVPRTAGKVVKVVSVISWILIDYDVYHCIKKCAPHLGYGHRN